MTNEFAYLMELAGAAATGRRADVPERPVDWKRMLNLAREQTLLPLLCYAQKKGLVPGMPEECAAQLRSAFSTILTEEARKRAVIALLEEMEGAGIHAAVVKGFAVAAVYAVPESRISADTDIVISPQDERAACEFLRQRGFEVSPRWENGHHAVARHPRMGIVEVHVQLYDEIVEEIWFGKDAVGALLQEPQRRIETPDGAYYTLGDTDHLLFMMLHMVKHFIVSGASLRMLLDIAAFCAARKDTIDIRRIWAALTGMKYDRLVSAVLRAMVLYCGFAPEDFPGAGSAEPAQVEMILNDLESGGWLGRNSEEARKEGWYAYNRRKMIRDRGRCGYGIYMLNWQHSLRLSTLFPGCERLGREYPYLERHPWRLPQAWVHRLAFKGRKLLGLNSPWKKIIADESRLGEEGKRRLRMFEKLDML